MQRTRHFKRTNQAEDNADGLGKVLFAALQPRGEISGTHQIVNDPTEPPFADTKNRHT
jgi:hypothetical protein